MSYNSSTKVISAPVTIDDVRTALGETSYDLETLCKSGKINGNAKFKPVQNKGLAISTTSSTKSLVTPANEWWQGDAGDCGISFVSVTSTADIPSASSSIVYKPPTSDFRLLDFEGYWHGAPDMLLDVTVTPDVVGNDSDGQFYVYMSVPPVVSGKESLRFDNFPKLKNYYFGIVFKPVSSAYANKVVYITAEEQIGTQLLSGITLRTYGTQSFPTGQWRVYPFLSSVKISKTNSPTSGTFYRVGNFKTVYIQANWINAVITKITWESNTSITINYKITNKLSSAIQENTMTLSFQVTDDYQYNSTSTKATIINEVYKYSISEGGYATGSKTITGLNASLATTGGLVLLGCSVTSGKWVGSLTLPAKS